MEIERRLRRYISGYCALGNRGLGEGGSDVYFLGGRKGARLAETGGSISFLETPCVIKGIWLVQLAITLNKDKRDI